jgi:hypothetical protein
MNESLCSFCKNFHDPFDMDACDRILHPRMYADMMQRRADAKRAQEAYRRNGPGKGVSPN